KEKKYLLIQAPTGTGKSAIAYVYSRFVSENNLGNTYFLTPQKILQFQYEKSFEQHNLVSLYGKSNYKCEYHNGNCEQGCNRNAGRPCNGCPWDEQKNKAIKSPNVVF